MGHFARECPKKQGRTRVNEAEYYRAEEEGPVYNPPVKEATLEEVFEQVNKLSPTEKEKYLDYFHANPSPTSNFTDA